MPKTNLQRQESYYERIIKESKKSPLTPQYQAICQALEPLVKLSKKLNNPEVKMSETEFTQLQKCYQNVQTACKSYFEANVELSTFEKNRQGVMEGISRVITKDMNMLGKCNPKEPGSLSEIIGRSRSHSIVLNGDSIQKVGGALSSRIPLKTPSGKKGFFTPSSTYNMDKEWTEQINKHMDKLSSFVDKSKLEKLKTDPEFIHQFCVYCPGRPLKEYLAITKSKSQVKDKVHNVAKVLGIAEDAKKAGEILESDKSGMKKAICDFIDSMALMANQYGMMYTAGIKKGSNISNRNCAMTDMARLLGCSGVLANSAPMKIKIGDKEVEGVFMEAAEGSDIHNLKDGDLIFGASSSSFSSPKVMEQMLDLQVLDYICGNIDRHDANIIYQFGKDKKGNIVLNGIKGIDNDCSFGLVNPKDGRGVQQMVHPDNMQYIREETLHKLESLNENIIRTQFAPYKFSDKEIKAVCERIEQVKQAVEKGKLHKMEKDMWEKKSVVNMKTNEGNYLSKIKYIAQDCMEGYKRDSRYDKYNEINYMKDRRESNKVLLSKGDEIARLREQMDKAKARFFNSSEYNMMKKGFEQVEKLSKELNAEYKGRLEQIPEPKAAQLEKAYTELADKTFRYIKLKKIVPYTGDGQKRLEFAQGLLEFAGDTLQEAHKKPEMENAKKNDEPMEKEEKTDDMEL